MVKAIELTVHLRCPANIYVNKMPPISGRVPVLVPIEIILENFSISAIDLDAFKDGRLMWQLHNQDGALAHAKVIAATLEQQIWSVLPGQSICGRGTVEFDGRFLANGASYILKCEFLGKHSEAKFTTHDVFYFEVC